MAEETLTNTEKSNQELSKANEYNEKYGLYWAILFFSLGFMLLFFDFVK